MKLTNILKEIVVQGGNVFPPKYLKNLENLTDGFGEGNDNFSINEPLTEYYYLAIYDGWEEWEEDGEEHTYFDFKALIDNLPNGTYVTNNSWMSFNNFPCPGAPKGAYALRVVIDKTTDPSNPLIQVSTPAPDNSGEFSVGWFDALGKYYFDTKHFTDDGEYIA
jgi:hypothetical protein